MSHRPRVFYGWWVVATASLGMCFSTGTIVALSCGVFFKPLSQHFHAGRAAVSLAFTLHNLVASACVPLIGRLIDCFGARKVILTGEEEHGTISATEWNRLRELLSLIDRVNAGDWSPVTTSNVEEAV